MTTIRDRINAAQLVPDHELQSIANERGFKLSRYTCEAIRTTAVCACETPQTIAHLLVDAADGDHSGIGELGSHVAAILLEGLMKDLAIAERFDDSFERAQSRSSLALDAAADL
ncbi:MAG: hypothetical protein E6Q97_28855 [Desulfurellales bacterium]|nr:MAG: hypothetical protein E6Q97_28855 [Desulfurellales bacterium]